MKTTRCKMTVSKVDRLTDGKGNHFQTSVEMAPVYDDGCEENKAFWDATPCGSLQLSVNNVTALPADLAEGDEFYVDLTRVEK